jgi:peptidoglycan/xylan/chitin deacetylase (PgdA/CDA1 family)
MNRGAVRWSANVGALLVDSIGLLPMRPNVPRLRILMYHGILPTGPSRFSSEAMDSRAFRAHVEYLKRNFRVLHCNELEGQLEKPSSDARPAVLLTFDDGMGNNATVAAPILEDLQVPAIFFVSTRHTRPGKFLWFGHASAIFSLWPAKSIELLGRKWPLTSLAQRQLRFNEFVAQTYKHPVQQIYMDLAHYPAEKFLPEQVIEYELRGMSEREIAAVASGTCITIGAHTVDHPYLTHCNDEELHGEIEGSKLELERICGREVGIFAYPDGDYDARVAGAVEQAGFRLAFSVSERSAGRLGRMSIMRAGVYHPGLGLLAMKARGWIN